MQATRLTLAALLFLAGLPATAQGAGLAVQFEPPAQVAPAAARRTLSAGSAVRGAAPKAADVVAGTRSM